MSQQSIDVTFKYISSLFQSHSYTAPTVVTTMETYLEIVRNKNFFGRWLGLRAPTEVKFRKVDETEMKQKERVIWECCCELSLEKWMFRLIESLASKKWIQLLAGYVQAGKLCVPKCTHCMNGKCIEPEMCKCYAGYGGSTCEMSKWKLNDCNCVDYIKILSIRCRMSGRYERRELHTCLQVPE